MKKSEQQGNQPQKVGYLKYLRLQKKELGVNHTFDDYFAFTRKYQPGGFLYFLHCLPQRISNRIDRYKIEHLKLGKQKWRNGKLYIGAHSDVEPSKEKTAALRNICENGKTEISAQYAPLFYLKKILNFAGYNLAFIEDGILGLAIG